MSKKNVIKCLFGNHFVNHSVTYTCISVTSAMALSGFDVSVMGLSCGPSFSSPIYKNGIPSFILPIARKFFSAKQIKNALEARFFSTLNKSDIVYLWPSASVELFEQIKKNGNVILTENINCHQATSKKIIVEEFAALGLTPELNITDASIESETRKLALCDFTFSPSPLVTQSLIDAGVAKEKIIESSYGLTRKERMPLKDFGQNPKKETTAIMVGRAGIRKGIHLLLDYWDTANINGKLQIIGNVEKSAEPIVANYRNHPKIEFVGFVSDVAAYYRNADFFILPSLEEGSPLVTYAALGASLPCLVSPMAGAGVINHGVEGSILLPHDKTSWVSAIREISENDSLRQSQSISAWNLSENFLWDNVGRRRAEKLLQLLN